MKVNLERQTGASAVEFAILLPILIVFVFGIIEFGFAMYDKAVITNASREGARCGIVYREEPRDFAAEDSEIKERVNSYCQDRLITFGSQQNILPPGITRTGDELTVTVAYKYDYLLLPAFISSLTGGISMNAKTVMRME